jgi:protein SCO1/2
VKAVPGLADKVRLLSFSVDPERDTPEDLDAFSKSYGADPSLWHFLTGEQGAVAKLSGETFRLSAMEGPATTDSPGLDPGHSDRFVLVDSEGYIRDYYRPISEKRDLETLIEAIKHLTSR